MRLPGRSTDCGTLLELGWVTRQLRLRPPVDAGTETIPVAHIIGTAGRGRDFDGCWNPTEPAMAKRLSDIAAASPVGMDEPIEVVRVDRAFFVIDGHKRVALARRTGREFLDANVRIQRSDYELTHEVDREAIMRTAREGEFRRHTGLDAALPEARFALTNVDEYGELFESVRAHAYDLSQREQRFVPPAEAAADWYRTVYLPTVSEGRRAIGGLIDPCSDAEAFLLVHRQGLASWGSECDAPGCAAERVGQTMPGRGRLADLTRRLTGRPVGGGGARVLPHSGDRAGPVHD